MKMVKSLLDPYHGISIETIIEGDGGYHDPFDGIRPIEPIIGEETSG